MKIIKIITLIAILLNLNPYIFAQGNNKNDVKNILIINSYNAENTWEKSVYEGFNKVLNSKYDKINIKSEYLDIPEDNNELYVENFKSLLNNKYENEEITKFEEGFYECKCSNENIVYIVEDVVNESIDFANQKNIDVIFDTEEEEILCCIDKEKIERVVLNIISNAIKFTSENGKINVYIKREADIVSISIKDNGVGIPKDKLEQIFYRFYQVDSLLCRSNEGSGIGLCITNEIIKMHDGNIKVDSTEGIGSVFEVRLPIKVCTNISKDINNNRHLKDIVKIELSDIDK